MQILVENMRQSRQEKLKSISNCKRFSIITKQSKQENRRLHTQPLQIEKNKSIKKTNQKSFQKSSSSLFYKDYKDKLPRGIMNMRRIQKRIVRINKLFECKQREIRMSPREKQNIRSHMKTQLCKMIKNKQQKLESHQKMMIKFQKELRRIKKQHNCQKFDSIKQNKEKFQSFCINSHRNNTQMQDSCKVGQGIHVLCDANGSNGRQVAKFVCQSIYEKIVLIKRQGKIDEKSVAQVFQQIHQQLELSGIDISFSGSACLLIIILEKEILIANLGDSMAIIKKQHKIQILSNSHVPSFQSQRQRISIIGGIVRQQQISKGKYAGPQKIWAPGKNSWGPGLAVSRSFGHKAARRYGLISQVEIKMLGIEQSIIVMGSKGLFQGLKNEEIMDLIKKMLSIGEDKQKICQFLAEQALKKTEQQIEDISVILVFL